MSLYQSVALHDMSQVGEARRLATKIADDLGFDDVARGRAALVATELASNIVKHGGGGRMLVGRVLGSDAELDLLALDKGRGMVNIERCLTDGYSTSGTPGTGLGAVQRQASLFDIYSLPERGTAVLARISADNRPKPPSSSPFTIGGIGLAYPGERVSGDRWSFAPALDHMTVLVVDGLGHGLAAAQAADVAAALFARESGRSPADLLQILHQGMRGTRGAAAAVARVPVTAGKLQFAGIGNIVARIVSEDGASKSMVSHNGIVGHEVRKIQAFEQDWSADAMLVMHSDGVGTSWRPAQFPSLRRHHPTLASAVLLRDYERGNDDATVVSLYVSVR